jgi:hypothetical protein
VEAGHGGAIFVYPSALYGQAGVSADLDAGFSASSVADTAYHVHVTGRGLHSSTSQLNLTRL